MYVYETIREYIKFFKDAKLKQFVSTSLSHSWEGQSILKGDSYFLQFCLLVSALIQDLM